LSNLFEAPVFDHPSSPNPNIYPTTRNNKSIQRNANTPMVEHRNKWKSVRESMRNIKGPVFGVTVLLFPGLGVIISLESGVQPNKKVY
jgi:hypothetical protein